MNRIDWNNILAYLDKCHKIHSKLTIEQHEQIKAYECVQEMKRMINE